ncbi:MAG: TIGR04076 family protein [Clostridia bacterium]|nr:TIGR04076 family protein [Clostridia bacterium]
MSKKTVKITAVKQVVHTDLINVYENPIEHTCDIKIGDTYLSFDGKKPENLCDSAWESMEKFVVELANGGGNFYDGWMKNPKSAMISCNDGFRPVSFYIEVVDCE